MKMLRLFIAIPVPLPVKNLLVEAQKILNQVNPHVRPVALPAIHLTLKFLGAAPEKKIGEIVHVMREAAALVPRPIQLQCVGTGAFPGLDRPQVVWAGLTGDLDLLSGMVLGLERHLEPVGFPPDSKPFHPHITIARMKHPKMLGALHKAWPRVQHQPFGEFTAEAMVLYHSELRPEGAVYTSIERILLP